jgi:hypothetical protein
MMRSRIIVPYMHHRSPPVVSCSRPRPGRRQQHLARSPRRSAVCQSVSSDTAHPGKCRGTPPRYISPKWVGSRGTPRVSGIRPSPVHASPEEGRRSVMVLTGLFWACGLESQKRARFPPGHPPPGSRGRRDRFRISHRLLSSG